MTQRPSTVHLPSPSGLPLCGRVLSRNTPLTQRNQDTMAVGQGQVAEGFSPSMARSRKTCRHCQRSAGLLPALTRRSVAEAPEPEDMEEGEE